MKSMLSVVVVDGDVRGVVEDDDEAAGRARDDGVGDDELGHPADAQHAEVEKCPAKASPAAVGVAQVPTVHQHEAAHDDGDRTTSLALLLVVGAEHALEHNHLGVAERVGQGAEA